MAQRSRQTLAVQLPDVFGRNQKNLAATLGNVLANLRQATALYQYRIAAMRRLDEIGRHKTVVPRSRQRLPRGQPRISGQTQGIQALTGHGSTRTKTGSLQVDNTHIKGALVVYFLTKPSATTREKEKVCD
jgi:hypothetical protein